MQVRKMFRVNNSKVITLLSKRAVKHNKIRNLVAVIAIILTTVLFTNVFTVGLSIVESTQLSTMRQVGTKAHGGFKFLTWEQYEKVKSDAKLKDVSYNIYVGTAANGELGKVYTEIRYTEEKAAQWSFSMPTTGTLPKERLDIATSTIVLDALGIPHELGAIVPLTFTANGVTYTEDFTLCGFWEQDEAMAANEAFLSREYVDEVAPVWHEIPERFGELSYEAGSVHPSLWFSNSWNLNAQMQALKERCGFGDDVNIGVNWAYMTAEADGTTVGLIAGLLLLIILSGYLIIYNIFYISVSSEIRFYGLLKTIGTTKRQLRRIVRKQALLLSLLGIPIGLIAGYLISVRVMPMIMSTTSLDSAYVVSASPWIFAGSAVFTLFTVWISCIKPCRLVCRISPVEAVRYTQREVKKSKRQKKSRRVTTRSMAFGNIKRMPKKTAAVVLSLSLSLILLNGTVTLVKGFDMDKYLENSVVSDFYIGDAALMNMNYNGISFNSVTEEVRDQIAQLEGIEEMGSVYMCEQEHRLSEEKCEHAKQLLEQYREEIFGRPEYSIEVERLLNEESSMYSHLYGVDEFVAGKMELVDGQLDMEKFKSGNYVIATALTEDGSERFYEVGDKVEKDFGDGVKKEYEVLALGDIPSALSPMHGHFFDVYFTLYSDEFTAMTGETGALKTAFDVEEEYVEQTEEWLENYCENVNTELDFRSRSFFQNEFKSLQDMFLLVGGALSFILALIGVLNFVNAVITSIQTRRRELAVIQSVGMTGGQLKQMLIFEGIGYILLTAVFVLTVGSILVYALTGAISIWFFTYHFVIAPILLCLPVLLLISVLVPTLCYKNMCKNSVVDRLRESE